MHTHIRVLGILHIVFGALGIMAGLAALMVFGGLAGMVSVSGAGEEAWFAAPLFGTIGVAVLALAMILAIPGIVAGIGLLSYRPWARVLMIVLSALHILNFPLGTALGVYGLWALLSPEGQQSFTRAPASMVQTQ